jgi:Domain of unknown function (DUF4091)/Family of unknown function (DUF6067)
MRNAAVCIVVGVIAFLSGCGGGSDSPDTAGSTAASPVPLLLTVPALGSAVQGAAYTSAAITASGGTGAIHWTSTALPAGLRLSADAGASVQITGTPTASGSFNDIVVTATDSGAGSSLQTKSSSPLSLTVLPRSAGASNVSAIWANDGGDKVTQDELRASTSPSAVQNSLWNGTTISLFGARNEVINFNLILEAASTSAANVSVTLANLTGPGGSVIRYAPRATDDLFDWTATESELFYVRYLQIQGLSSLNGYAGFGLTGSAIEPQLPAKLRLPLLNGTYTGGWVDRPNHDKFYPDIAVPLELVPTFTIAQGSNQAIWADIYIPKTAASGAYAGTVSISENGVVTHTVPVSLTVRNFTLPDVPSSRTMLFSEYSDIAERYTGVSSPARGGAQDTLAERVLTNQRLVAHRHKISLIGDDAAFSNGTGTTQPGTAYVSSLTGSLFTTANGYAGPGAGVGNNVYSIGSYGTWNWANTQAAFNTATNAWESWFEANSPTTERFVYLIDESSNFTQTQQWANWMATNPGVGVRLKSMATLSATSAANVPSLNIPTSLFYSGNTMTWQNAVTAIETAPGKELWMYNTPRPGAGAFATEVDGTDLREKPWAQYKKGVSRWFFWEGTYYNDYQNGRGNYDVLNDANTFGPANPTQDTYNGLDPICNGNGVLLYPGSDAIFPASSYGIPGPIASLRLKYWRRGIQDIDYVVMAYAINPTAVANLVQQMVPQALWELPNTGNVGPSWSSDPDDWEAARLALAHIIDGE